MSTRVLAASATRQFPLLPLASDAKRSNGLFQLLGEKREDALRGLRSFGRAVLVENVDLAPLLGRLPLDAVLLRLPLGILGGPIEKPRQQSRLVGLLAHLRLVCGLRRALH